MNELDKALAAAPPALREGLILEREMALKELWSLLWLATRTAERLDDQATLDVLLPLLVRVQRARSAHAAAHGG